MSYRFKTAQDLFLACPAIARDMRAVPTEHAFDRVLPRSLLCRASALRGDYVLCLPCFPSGLRCGVAHDML